MATTSEKIEEAQAILDSLNSALTTSYQTTGTFITGRLIMCHEDIYHHADQHPVASVDYLELNNAPSEVVDLVAELNAKIAEIHYDYKVDTTGSLRYAHQDQAGTPALRSEEIISVDLTFEDKAAHAIFCATTKLPHDVGQREDHKAAVAEMQERYDELLRTGVTSIPPEHYRPKV